ncbi:hypothetical protein EZS27_012415 [termite gut metagenome]|uniref:Glycosyl hydrolases family 2 sugar binding domain-containing protein n=1 Tax=termite gut metagenome TaxID=433724 RepID=A0A5J4S0N9_9ZZZZ
MNGVGYFPKLPQDTALPAPYTPYPEGKLLFTSVGEYTLTTSNGKIRQLPISALQTLKITPPWEVSFDPERGGPAHIRFDSLMFWNTHPYPAIRYYSGTAEYANTFILNEAYSRQRVYLSLGQVYNMVEVYINEKPAGVWWHPPFERDITALLKPGENKLRINVINLWPNRLIGDAGLPENERLTHTNVIKFTPEMPLLPSGLIGPVELKIYPFE